VNYPGGQIFVIFEAFPGIGKSLRLQESDVCRHDSLAWPRMMSIAAYPRLQPSVDGSMRFRQDSDPRCGLLTTGTCFPRKSGSGEPPSPGHNGEADFRKMKRSNEAHIDGRGRASDRRKKVENVDETKLASPAMPNVCIWRYRLGEVPRTRHRQAL
jgi:hypothetical protein